MDYCYLYIRVFCGHMEEEKGEALEYTSGDILESFYEPTEDALPMLDYFNAWLKQQKIHNSQPRGIFSTFRLIDANIQNSHQKPKRPQYPLS